MPQRVAFFPARERKHAQAGREPFGFSLPVVDHRCRAHDQRRATFRVAFAQPFDPRQSLNGLSEAHVVGEDRAHAQPGHEREEIKPVALVGPKDRFEARRYWDARQALEPQDSLAQPFDLADRAGIAAERFQRGETLGPRPGQLRHRQSLLSRTGFDAQIREDVRGVVECLDPIATDPSGGELHVPGTGGPQPHEIGFAERASLGLPLCGDREPIDPTGHDRHARADRALLGEQVLHAGVAEEQDVARAPFPRLGERFETACSDVDPGIAVAVGRAGGGASRWTRLAPHDRKLT